MLNLKHVNLHQDSYMMPIQKKINRKTFFKWASVSLAIPVVYVWNSSVKNHKKFSQQEQILEIEEAIPEGVHFFGRVILVKKSKSYKLMSSKCTHLGCEIDKMENGEMVCPCHGSRYDKNGRPVKGPATENLKEIEYELAQVDGRLIFRYTL